VDPRSASERLRRLREEFSGTLADLRTRLAEPQREASGEVATVDQHPADIATDTAERELDVSRIAMFEARLKQIDDALERLKQGGYGICEVCGQPIPDERLEAIPDTPFCVRDAQREQARAQ
jgi:RNA polymerase-binding transcription factor DksA